MAHSILQTQNPIPKTINSQPKTQNLKALHTHPKTSNPTILTLEPVNRELLRLSDPALRSRLHELATLLEVEVGAEGVTPAGGDSWGGDVEALADACVHAVERLIAPFWTTHVDTPPRDRRDVGRAGSEANAGSGSGGGGSGGGGRGGEGGGSRDGGENPAATLWNLPVTDFPSGIALGGPGAGPAVEAAVNVLRVLHVNDLRVKPKP